MIPDWLRLPRPMEAWLRCGSCKVLDSNDFELDVPTYKEGHKRWVVDCEDTRPWEHGADLKVEVLRVRLRPFPGLTGNVIRVQDDLDCIALVAYGTRVAWVKTNSLAEAA